MMTSPLLLLVFVLQQSTPTGGAITKYVPPAPTPASFISDLRTVLTAEQRRALDARITRVQRAGLGDIAVAILPSIGSYTPNQVAVEIYRTWKVGSVAPIGSARRNVGVLLLIVPKELAPDNKGQCWLNTGTGSEGMITDAIAGAICRDSIIPRLRARDYAGGIAAGINAIEARMQRDSALVNAPRGVAQPTRAVSRPPSRARSGGAAAALLLGGFVALFLAIVGGVRYARHRARTCPRCRKQMRRLDEQADDAKLDRGQQLEEKLQSVDYDVWVCDCGESKVIPYRRWFSKHTECRGCHRRTASAMYRIITPATTMTTGYAEKRFKCQNCGEAWIDRIILPRIEQSSSSSSGSFGGGGGGGGGGGSSFGGSGSTAGGGGGSSY